MALTFMRPIAQRIGALPWLPTYLPQIVKVDKAIQRVSRGRLTLLWFAGLPNLTLRVPGRRTGIVRETPLLTTPYDGGWLIAGSNFGGAKPPVWVHNLTAVETADILVDGHHLRVRWRELSGDERAAAWRAMLRTWRNYALYEKKTSRTIRVFLLERA